MATQEITRLGAIVFGATGFTGQFAVLELWKLAKEKGNFTWGISGRNKTKLEDLLKEISKKTSEDLTKIPIIIADIKDSESLNAMAKRCQIVINCAGPYRFYGEAVVKACVASGTHHVDVSGEPQYMERMQLEYHKAAEEKGVYIVSACGFDSIPADLGTAFFVKTFGGDVNSVETYLQSSLKKGINAEGAVLHYGTWESAVYGLAHANELKPLRTKLFPNRLPPMTPKLKPRPLVHKSKLVKGWCVPFPGSDRSVVMRSQRYFLESKKQRPVQMLAYASFDSIFTVLALAFVGLIFAMFSRFSFGRMLLLKFPRLFSCGFASHEGPTEEVMKNTEFSITFYCEGWKEKLAEPTDIHTSPPNKKLIGKVSGMDPGYGLTATALVMSAITVLEESSKMPGKGGVFPPGAAFSETSLIEQLNKRGMTFEVLSVEDVK